MGSGALSTLEVSLPAHGLSTILGSLPVPGAGLDSAETRAEPGAFAAFELAGGVVMAVPCSPTISDWRLPEQPRNLELWSEESGLGQFGLKSHGSILHAESTSRN